MGSCIQATTMTSFSESPLFQTVDAQINECSDQWMYDHYRLNKCNPIPYTFFKNSNLKHGPFWFSSKTIDNTV